MAPLGSPNALLRRQLGSVPPSAPPAATPRAQRGAPAPAGAHGRKAESGLARPGQAAQDGGGSRLRGALGRRPRDGRLWKAGGGGRSLRPTSAGSISRKFTWASASTLARVVY